MMQKITKLRTSSHWMDDLVVGRVSGPNLQKSLGKKCNTPMWYLPKILQCLSQKGEKAVQREKKNDLGSFWVSICVYFKLCCPYFLELFLVLMGNEPQQPQHSWATASVLSMGALKYTAHLLPLLRPLLFIINACNKCVTLVLVVIDME